MSTPPRLPAALLRSALPDDVRGQTIAGDLRQEFDEKAEQSGRLYLWLWYWAQVLELGGRYLVFRGRNAAARPKTKATHRSSTDPTVVVVRSLTKEEAMENFWTDLRYGVRMLFRTPTLSSISILTIGLGIGLVTFTFSIVYGAVLRPMPVRDADRLVSIAGTMPERGFDGMSMPMADLVAFRDQSTAFETLAGGYNGTVNIASDEGPPQRFEGAFMTANGLDILGVPPFLGRTFQPGEDVPGAEGTVVLGYDVWRNDFAADESVIETIQSPFRPYVDIEISAVRNLSGWEVS